MKHITFTKTIMFILILLSPSIIQAEPAIAEYANSQSDKWTQVNNDLEIRFKRLLKDAKNTPDEEKLIEAKVKWEEFREIFCHSVSSIYGGAWASTQKSECRVKLAQEFINSMSGYGW